MVICTTGSGRDLCRMCALKLWFRFSFGTRVRGSAPAAYRGKSDLAAPLPPLPPPSQLAALGCGNHLYAPVRLDVCSRVPRSLEEYLALYDTPSLYDAPREIRHLRVTTSSSGHDEDDPVDGDGDGDNVFSSYGAGPALPPSMLLHASALLRITHSTRGSASPLCHLRVPKTAR